MELAEAEGLASEFLARAGTPLPALPARWRYKAKRPIGDEDLSALDALMRRLLELDEFDVRRLARRLGAEVPSARHRSMLLVRHRWAIFRHLKEKILALRDGHGTARRKGVGFVVREGATQAGEAAAGAGRPVGVGQDV